MKLSDLKVKKLDLYIMGKFLGTYFFTLGLLIVIVVIFDMSEKVEDFLENHAPASEIAFDYYVNFIPFFMNQFSGLITFISVILFTSKMAYQTEIIAILSGGVSFKRLLYPYALSALIITFFSLALNLYIIPISNQQRIEFEIKYLKKNQRNLYDDYVYRQIEPGTFIQIRGYSRRTNSADFIVISTQKDGELVSMLSAERAQFNKENNHWTAHKYMVRKFENGVETLQKHKDLDTLVNLTVAELGRINNHIVTLNAPQLNQFIDEQIAKGSDLMPYLYVEKQNRLAYPIATIILTLIGVSLSSRKVRGGTGFHISAGIALCFSYILIMRFGNEYAKANTQWASLAVWVPNIIYTFIAIYLYHKAPK